MADAEPAVPPGAAALFASHGAPGSVVALAMVGASNPRALPAGFVEVFLIGPRLIMNGIRHLRQAGELSNTPDRRAVEVVAQLLQNERGIKPETLQAPGEDMKSLVRVLVWLAFYGWVGVSDKMDRVYLYSESRDVMAKR